MSLFTQSSFRASRVRSLCWRGDELVDWVGGGRFTLGGEERESRVLFGYRFDAATASPDGRFAAIYERTGTKGLLLAEGKIVREIDRSYYCADAYEYPIALFREPSGRLLLAHCPKNYNRIELEDAETGQPLTTSDSRRPEDFFHSRLAFSPTGKRLLSAGWVWHPWDAVADFEVGRALVDPCHLDKGDSLPPPRSGRFAEESSACWLNDDFVAASASSDADDSEQDSATSFAEPHLRPNGLAIYDLVSRSCIRAFQFNEPPGSILAVGETHVLSLYGHPKLIDLSTGEVLHEWTELGSGRQQGSIMRGLEDDAMPPPMAFDPTNMRFAIVNDDTVTVIAFNVSALDARASLTTGGS